MHKDQGSQYGNKLLLLDAQTGSSHFLFNEVSWRLKTFFNLMSRFMKVW